MTKSEVFDFHTEPDSYVNRYEEKQALKDFDILILKGKFLKKANVNCTYSVISL